MELREASDEADKAAKSAKAEFREAEADLFDKLTDPDTGDVRRIPPVDLGPPFGRVAFQARETYYGRIIDEQAALEHFRSKGVLEEVASPKFVMKRINEEVREAIEAGVSPPPGTDFYANRGVTITRQKG
jgi:hypothetical protein